METRSPLKWVGGKFEAAGRILAEFPHPSTYTDYIEPCGGAAHVLAHKPSYGHREVYNDLNNDLVNFWLQVRDNHEALAKHLTSLPYARHTYYEYYISLYNGEELDPLERAARFFYVLRSTGTGWMRISPQGWNHLHSNVAAYRGVLATGLEEISARFQRVRIDNRDIERVLAIYDSPTTLFYIDPPYLGADGYYVYQQGAKKYGKKRFNHKHLSEMLRNVEGRVVLSTYPHDQLDAWYPPDRWRRAMWEQPKHSAIQPGQEYERAVEMVLCNYEQPSTSALAVKMASLWEENTL